MAGFGVRKGTRIRILQTEGRHDYDGVEGVVEKISSTGELNGTWGDLTLLPNWDKIEVLK